MNYTDTERIFNWPSLPIKKWKFLSLLRWLCASYPGTSANSPHLAQHGVAGVKIIQKPILHFSVAEVQSVTMPSSPEQMPELILSMLGCWGGNGCFSLELTEDWQRLSHIQQTTDEWKGLLDVLQQRFFWLFYQAWAAWQPALNFDQPQHKRYQPHLSALLGYLLPVKNQQAASDVLCCRHIPVFGHQIKTAEKLERLLALEIEIVVTVVPFIGHWMDIQGDNHLQFSAHPFLGLNTILGRRVWGRQDCFRVIFYCASWADYLELLPHQRKHQWVIRCIRNYIGIEFIWSIQLRVSPKDIAVCAFVHKNLILGQTSWLGGGKESKNTNHLIFYPTCF